MDKHSGRDGSQGNGPQTAVWRQSLSLWLVIAGVAVCAITAVAIWARAKTPTLQGAEVTPPAPAYDFSLHDQANRMIRLSAFHGKAVALTFLYTRCPDVCPLIAGKLHETYTQLGGAATRVAFLAVSVDPRGDAPGDVRRFLSTHRLDGELSYLTGSFAELTPIWAHYYVGSDAREVNPQAAAVTRASPDLVDHTAIVYVIDPRGNLRVFLPGNFEPKDLATDLKILVEPAE